MGELRLGSWRRCRQSLLVALGFILEMCLNSFEFEKREDDAQGTGVNARQKILFMIG